MFMLIYYRLPGVVASFALIYYTFVVLAIFRLIPVTLTLAGIAGFVLSIGMAVDANILIFERMKEEMRVGKTLPAAVEAGFGRAWNSILDSNVSSLITATILYLFGSSTIRGFALVLIIGVLVSMFSAIVVTRSILRWRGRPELVAQGVLVRRQRGGVRRGREATPRGRVRERPAPVFDIIGKRRWFFALSLIVTIPGLIFILLTFFTGGKQGLQFTIDYTGGTTWQIRFADANVTADQVATVFKEHGLQAVVVKQGNGFMDIKTDPIGLRPPEPVADARADPRAERQRLGRAVCLRGAVSIDRTIDGSRPPPPLRAPSRRRPRARRLRRRRRRPAPPPAPRPARAPPRAGRPERPGRRRRRAHPARTSATPSSRPRGRAARWSPPCRPRSARSPSRRR